MEELLKAISVTGQVIGLIIGDDFVTPETQVIEQYPNIQFDI